MSRPIGFEDGRVVRWFKKPVDGASSVDASLRALFSKFRLIQSGMMTALISSCMVMSRASASSDQWFH